MSTSIEKHQNDSNNSHRISSSSCRLHYCDFIPMSSSPASLMPQSDLPPSLKDVQAELPDKERKLYIYIYNRALMLFAEIVKAGIVTAGIKNTTVVTQILRRRCNPVLVEIGT